MIIELPKKKSHQLDLSYCLLMMLTIKNDYHFIIMKNSVKLKAVKIFYTFVYVFTVLEMNKKNYGTL